MSERRFRRLFADAPAGMALLSASGLIVDANEALCAIAHAEIPDLVGHHFTEFVLPEDNAVYEERFGRVLMHGSGGGLERPLLAVDGSIYWAQVKATKLEEEGLVAVHIQDVTDARRMREELAQRAEQLEQADRLKDELISVVSHDLRTPLTSIMGYLELALGDDAEGDLSDERRDYLLVAQRNAQRLHRLVEDLLFVSRVKSGRSGLRLEEHDVGRLVRDAVENALPTASSAQIVLTSHTAHAATAVVDSHRVSEAVENLISNALKFTPPGGSVDVTVECAGDDIVIRVEDTGIGVPAEDIAHLFDRFFRTSSAESIPGAGLGLSIVKAIVDAHGGAVEVASAENTGTTFELRLPRGNG